MATETPEERAARLAVTAERRRLLFGLATFPRPPVASAVTEAIAADLLRLFYRG